MSGLFTPPSLAAATIAASTIDKLAAAGKGGVVVDLHPVEFVDAGLVALISGFKSASHQRGHLRIAAAAQPGGRGAQPEEPARFPAPYATAAKALMTGDGAPK